MDIEMQCSDHDESINNDATSTHIPSVMQRGGRRCKKSTAVLIFVDCLKILPTIVWGIVCLVSIPVYANIGWITPIICSVFSLLLASLATYDIVMYLAPSMRKYVLIQQRTLPPHSCLECCKPTDLTPKKACIKIVVAGTFTIVTIALSTLFLVVGYAYIIPEKTYQPCKGLCRNCSIDPYCKSWAKLVTNKYPSTYVCPPAQFPHFDSDGTNATFSCLADGFWMIITAVAGVIWLSATVCIKRKVTKY